MAKGIWKLNCYLKEGLKDFVYCLATAFINQVSKLVHVHIMCFRKEKTSSTSVARLIFPC